VKSIGNVSMIVTQLEEIIFLGVLFLAGNKAQDLHLHMNWSINQARTSRPALNLRVMFFIKCAKYILVYI
jgi:hypothetical protein